MMILQDLTQPEGIQHLLKVTGGTQSFYNHPSRAEGVRQVAINAIQANPNMAPTPVRILPNLPNAFYNYDKKEIVLGLVNPAALAHELGHANNLNQEGLYQKVLHAANGIARANNMLALPTMLALRTFIQDEDKRNDILKTLAAISVATSAPGLLEEVAASAQAMKNSPDRMRALGTLGPAFLQHAASSFAPALIYQAGRM